jgi:hypothetical protein
MQPAVQYDDKPCAETAPFCKKDGTGMCDAKDGTCSVCCLSLHALLGCCIAIHLYVGHICASSTCRGCLRLRVRLHGMHLARPANCQVQCVRHNV